MTVALWFKQSQKDLVQEAIQSLDEIVFHDWHIGQKPIAKIMKEDADKFGLFIEYNGESPVSVLKVTMMLVRSFVWGFLIAKGEKLEYMECEYVRQKGE